MHLTLLVADLVPPPLFIARQDLPVMPALQALLAQGNIINQPGAFLEEACLQQLGLKHIASNPIAALTLLADGGTPDTHTWVRADPVHLHVSRDNVQLMDSHVVDPTMDEANAIVATLNRHLAEDGLAIEVHDAARWYLRIPREEAPETTTLWRANGSNVFDKLPADGKGKINWRRLQNELQMLLVEHAVNVARDANNQPTINGIWFWGAGEIAAPVLDLPKPNRKIMMPVVNRNNEIKPPVVPKLPNDHPYELILAKLALVRGLAKNAALPLADMPADFATAKESTVNTLCVIHTATRALRRNDRHEWMQVVAGLEANWFLPAREALKTRQLDSLTLLLSNESGSLRVKLGRTRPWEFWKRVTPVRKVGSYV